MKISTLGSGQMAAALAPRWIAAGHSVLVGGRNEVHAKALAQRIGAQHGSLADAADFGEVVLLAVRSEGLQEALTMAGASQGRLAGKVVIDCGNSVVVSNFSQVLWDGRSLAEEVEFRAIGSQVVKAFNLCHADVWRESRTYGGHGLTVPFCGPEQAKKVVEPLIADVGGLPMDVGDLTQARHLEAMGIVVIRALVGGLDPLSVFNLVPADHP